MRTNKKELLAVLPIDRICKGCKRIYLDDADWRLTVFSDAVCAECLDRDKAKYPDLYSDPLLKHSLWRNAVTVVRQRKRELLRRKALIVGETTCAVCERTYRTTDRRIDWVYLSDADRWICRKCWYEVDTIRPDQYRHDTKFRVFRVTYRLTAQYPHKETRLPTTSTVSQYATEQTYNLQRDAMFNLVAKHLNIIENRANVYASRNRKLGLSFDEVYDVSLTAAMRAANTYNVTEAVERSGKPFIPYLYISLHKAVINYIVRQFKPRIEQEILSDIISLITDKPQLHPTWIPLTEIDIHQMVVDKAQLMYFFHRCSMEIDKDDWYLFCTWVLTDRTQKQLGEHCGVLQTTISARLKKVIDKCRRIAEQMGVQPSQAKL